MNRGVEKLAAGNGFARKIKTASTCAIEAARNQFTFRPSNGSLINTQEEIVQMIGSFTK